MANPTGSFIWYELMTPDPDAARAFYGAVTGWEIEAAPAGPMDYRMIVRDDGGHAGGVLRLNPDMAAHGARPGWVGYLSVPDVDAAVAAMQADGATTHMPPTTMDGVGRMAMVADPWGAAFYVMTPVPPPGMADMASDVFATAAPQRVTWNDYETTDLAGALAFYHKHFGWTMDETLDMGAAGQYHFIRHAGEQIGGMMTSHRGLARWSYYVRVKGRAEDALAAATGAGAEVFTGLHRVPSGDHVFKVTDPQGALIGFVGTGGE